MSPAGVGRAKPGAVSAMNNGTTTQVIFMVPSFVVVVVVVVFCPQTVNYIIAPTSCRHM